MGGSAGCADHRCLEWQPCAVDAGGHAIHQERAARTEESVRRRTADGGARGEESSLHQGGAPGSAASDHSVIRAIPATALDLQREAVQLLINDFFPAGTTLARWARPFDACLTTDNIVQACRNAWTACGLQPLLGERVGITSSILGYSLLYPYRDNYLDRADISTEEKAPLQ
jgi:hypothetical protein